MIKRRKYPATEEKALILKMHLVEKVPMSDLCDEYDLQPSQIYRWQKQLFENAAAAFWRTNKRAEHAKDRKRPAQKQNAWGGVARCFMDFEGERSAVRIRGSWNLFLLERILC